MIKDPPPPNIFNVSLTQNHTSIFYNSYIFQKYSKWELYQEVIYETIWSKLYLNPIELFELSDSIDCVQYENDYIIIYYLFFPWLTEYKSNL